MALHDYQHFAYRFLLDRLIIQDLEGAGLWLDPGLGKTLISLFFLRQVKAKRVLVIAPLRPCYAVWPKEIAKWGFNFRVSLVHGNEKQRRAALAADADVFVVNFEGLKWFSELILQHPQLPNFEYTVIDEVTGFKNWSAKRGKALRHVLHRLGKRITLTGTPAPNNYAELFPQIFLIDRGKSLGRNVTRFREMYCMPSGYQNYSWTTRPEVEPMLKAKIAPLVLRMDARDHLDMPELVENVIRFRLSGKVMSGYKQLEQELFLALDSGQTLFASSVAAKYSACRSVANGGMYQKDLATGQRSTHHIHDEKVAVLQELVDELNGKPLIVAYSFEHDYERLKKAFPKAPAVRSGVSGKESNRLIDQWNEGKIPLLLVQPQSLSHGANMQHGGSDLAWFSLTDQPEAHTQLNARLWRQGQGRQVRLHYLIAERTLDEVVYARIKSKDRSQAALLRAIAEYRKLVLS